MKQKSIILAALLVGIGIGITAFLLWQPQPLRLDATARQRPDEPAGQAARSTDRVSPRASERSAAGDNPHGFSLADLEQILRSELVAATPDALRVNEIISNLDPTDIPAALIMAEALLSNDTRRIFVVALLAKLAEQDPTNAIELATRLHPESGRSEALEKVFLSWMQSSPTAARNWAQERMSADLTDAAVAASNPSDDRDREAVVLVIAKAWATKDPFAAAEWVKGFPASHQRILALESVFTSWASADIATAAAAVLRISDPGLRNRLSAQVAAEWARSNPSTALAWVQSLPDETGRSEAARHVLLEIAAAAPDKAVGLAMALPAEDASETLSLLVQQWAARDINAAVQWLESLPPGKQRETALGDLLPMWTARQPDAAAAEVLQLPESEQKTELLNTVASHWAEKDPISAMNWILKSLERRELPETVLQSVITQWTGRDSAALGEWLNTLPQSVLRDSAVAAFARNIGSANPQAGITWAKTIADPAQRSEVIEGIAFAWLEQDAVVARKELTKTDLPAELRERLLAK